MFHNIDPSNQIHKIQESTLRPVYQNSDTRFSEFPNLSSSVTIHQRILKVLLEETFDL